MNPELIKSRIRNFAKPTRFNVTGFGLPDDLRIVCKAASLPAETIGTIEVPYQGRKIKIAGDRTYEPWTITIMNSIDFDVHQAILDWNASINGPVTNLGGEPLTYKREGIVEQLDEQDNVVKTYTFVGAWPSNIGAIELSFESNDAIEEFTVTLEYDLHV